MVAADRRVSLALDGPIGLAVVSTMNAVDLQEIRQMVDGQPLIGPYVVQ